MKEDRALRQKGGGRKVLKWPSTSLKSTTVARSGKKFLEKPHGNSSRKSPLKERKEKNLSMVLSLILYLSGVEICFIGSERLALLELFPGSPCSHKEMAVRATSL